MNRSGVNSRLQSLLGILIGATLSATPIATSPARAQASAVPTAPSAIHLPPITPTSNPFKNEIPLYPSKQFRGPEEQWEIYLGGPIVRNVINPTLIPMLPAAGKANGTAVIFAPGGGFKYEGMGNAEVQGLLDHGVTVFLLKYRLDTTARDPKVFLSELYKWLYGMVAQNKQPGASDAAAVHSPSPALDDGLAAVRLVRSRAKEWGIDPQRIGMMGGSAGGMVSLDVAYTKDPQARPNFIVAEISPKKLDPTPPSAPPLFAVASVDDPLFPGATENLVANWSKAGVPVEAHFYERGGHGLDEKSSAHNWIEGLYAWMGMHGWLAQTTS